MVFFDEICKILKSIFFDAANITTEALDIRCLNTMNTALGIKFTEIGSDFLKAEMPVSEATIQPLGMLNGGASLALIEITASMAANMVLNRNEFVAFGLDINANHIKPAFLGEKVTATASPFHMGRSTHVWEVKIHNEKMDLICVGRITMAVIPK